MSKNLSVNEMGKKEFACILAISNLFLESVAFWNQSEKDCLFDRKKIIDLVLNGSSD